MALGNMRIASAGVGIFLLALLSIPTTGQPDRITCTGILTEAETQTSASPLGIIHDAVGHYMCTIDRTASGDPLKPCSVGDKCRVIGTFRKVGQTYAIEKIISVDRQNRWRTNPSTHPARR
jgi:hypothetical protein